MNDIKYSIGMYVIIGRYMDESHSLTSLVDEFVVVMNMFSMKCK